MRKQAKTDDSQSSAGESEASLSESGSSPKAKSPASAKSKAKGAKKSPEESEEFQADDEASDSARVDLPEERTKTTGANKNKKDSNAQGSQQKGQKVGDAQKQAKADKGKPAKAGNADKKGKTGNEVVQTERVMERPEDPPPNAYYDSAHGILRLYHGPVYGSAHSHALYPRAYASGPPLPVGTPHPTQGLYFHGPNQTPPPHSQAHAPFTQGMPMAPYSAMYPPPAFDPGHLSGYPGGGPPADWQEAATQAKGSRGAFSMAGATVGSPSSRLQDRGGAYNVAPGGSKAYENPYYTRKNMSQFSTYGNGAAPNVGQGGGVGSGPAAGVANGGLPSHDGAPAVNLQTDNTQGASDQQPHNWGVGDQQEPQSIRGAPEQQTQPSDQTNKINGDTEANQQQGWNNNDSADNGPPAANDGGNVWEASTQTDQSAPGASGNGMPGSFPSDMAQAPGGWQDHTAAASTGGLVDAEPPASGSAPDGPW